MEILAAAARLRRTDPPLRGRQLLRVVDGQLCELLRQIVAAVYPGEESLGELAVLDGVDCVLAIVAVPGVMGKKGRDGADGGKFSRLSRGVVGVVTIWRRFSAGDCTLDLCVFLALFL